MNKLHEARHPEELLLVGARIYTPKPMRGPGYLRVRAGKIAEIGELAEGKQPLTEGAHVTDLEGAIVAPGFVDVHVHGGGGYDAMSGRPEDIDGMSLFLASKGATTFLPTTMTAEADALRSAVAAIGSAADRGTPGAEAAGIHLEGPFLNPERCGAQNPAHIRPPSVDELLDYMELSKGRIRLMTIAPEMPGAEAVIRLAAERGITVSIGHSAATYGQVRKAAGWGASHVTHLFNGMNALHHRDPGVPGAALASDELAVEVIGDLIHVHPEMIKLVFRCKPQDKVVLITDGIPATGMPDGRYALGGLPIVTRDGQARLLMPDGSGGSLAGSMLTPDRALVNAMTAAGLALEDVLPALTINPARQAGLASRKGSLEVGKDADFVVLDDRYAVIATYVKGRKVFGGS